MYARKLFQMRARCSSSNWVLQNIFGTLSKIWKFVDFIHMLEYEEKKVNFLVFVSGITVILLE